MNWGLAIVMISFKVLMCVSFQVQNFFNEGKIRYSWEEEIYSNSLIRLLKSFVFYKGTWAVYQGDRTLAEKGNTETFHNY